MEYDDDKVQKKTEAAEAVYAKIYKLLPTPNVTANVRHA
jgi:hypothetical protein